jgi:hypothetical protein
MEDSHVVLPAGTWKAPDPNMTYLAVHDGHGGKKFLIACHDVAVLCSDDVFFSLINTCFISMS